MAQTAIHASLSITEDSKEQSIYQKLGGLFVAIALLAVVVSLTGNGGSYSSLLLTVIITMFSLGGITYALPYLKSEAGVRNDGVMFKSMTSRGTIAWILAIVLTGFYVIIYWFPSLFEGLISVFDPLSKLITGQAANQWFMYGAFYSLAVLVMGIRFISKNRHSSYHVIRTFSVMFFPVGICISSFPCFLKKLNEPEFYFTYFWPLKV